MTTEAKALAIANTLFRPYRETLGQLSHKELMMTLEHVVERHEAFRQEVSDAVENLLGELGEYPSNTLRRHLHQFIISKPKPDPLVKIMEALDGEWTPDEYAKEIRAALDALGFEIREKNDD